MEHIGYILSFSNVKCFYCEWGITSDPFEAMFFFDMENAINVKNEIENDYQNSFEVIKVKKTIHVVD